MQANRLATVISGFNKNVLAVESMEEAVAKALETVKNGQSDMIIAFGTLSILKDVKESVIKLTNS